MLHWRWPWLSFQQRVAPWMQACFGPEISNDRLERADRLLEEVLELLQSGNYPRERIVALRDYVYARPCGEPAQEVGGVMVTLAAYCLAHKLDMQQAGEIELARIWTKVEAIRAKQAAKPTGSALPINISEDVMSETNKLTMLAETLYIIRSRKLKAGKLLKTIYYETPAMWNTSPMAATIFRTFEAGEAHLNMYHKRDKPQLGWADGSIEQLDVVPLHGEILQSPNAIRLEIKRDDQHD